MLFLFIVMNCYGIFPGGDVNKNLCSVHYFCIKQHFLVVIANFFSNGE